MRYADGQGGFSDALGGQGDGAHIEKLINAAAIEVANEAEKKPKLATLQAWIAANRAMLELEANSSSTRSIIIGTSFISLALIDGKFPTKSAAGAVNIPGVRTWVPPSKIRALGGHRHHWHLSLTAHP
ncbi:hypothetical protein D5039_16170 [Verminephrobacter aporrectodeae subsp. tuberculatae]|uniref:Uncharacterized protein n=1 Tax=Verminephrobacter aporrectodeae subsp. tuberculatae TaxID=1110392 RepID=A0ABT3KWD2_9BURK|nr:hypothetical protein [Verminephrobacter aporrectodeae]MCW5322628.1 hypothetical protein [Verminephrobacter aporrectodeae subsp. tuberculatae]